MQLGIVLERVDPAVANAIGELLLLAPEDRVGQVGLGRRVVRRVEGLAQDVLFDALGSDHLVRRVDVHGDLEELCCTAW